MQGVSCGFYVDPEITSRCYEGTALVKTDSDSSHYGICNSSPVYEAFDRINRIGMILEKSSYKIQLIQKIYHNLWG